MRLKIQSKIKNKTQRTLAALLLSTFALAGCEKPMPKEESAMSDTDTSSSIVAPNDVDRDDSLSIVAPLTGKAGNAEAGREAFANRKLGNCLACHANADLSEQLFHGNVGPSLDGVGARYPEGLLRSIVVDAKSVFGEQSVMPGFYSLSVGENVAEKFQGKTILSAEQVEDIVAYLTTLK